MAKSNTKSQSAKIAEQVNQPVGSQLSPEQEKLVNDTLANASVEAAPIPATTNQAVKDGDNMVRYQEEQNKAALEAETIPKPTANEAATKVEAIRLDIVAHYPKPNRSGADIKVDAQEALANVSTLDNEIGSLITRIAIDMADFGYAGLVSTDKEGNVVPSIFPNAAMAETLTKYCKDRNFFGDTLVIEDTHGEMVKLRGMERSKIIVDEVNPYKGANASVIKDASMLACLLLYQHKTGVVRGYIRKSEVSGKRFSRRMVFMRADQLTETMDNYHVTICIPTNVVIPWEYNMGQRDGGKTNVLRPETPNEDISLRHLNADWRFALYQHHFCDAELTYDLTSTGSKWPTGMLLKQAKAKRETGGTQTEANKKPQSLDEANKKIAAMEKQHAAEVTRLAESKIGPLNMPETWRVVDTLTASVKDITHSKAMSEYGLISVADLFDAMALFRLTRYSEKVPPTRLASTLGEIYRVLSQYIKYDEASGDTLWIDKNGKPLGVIDEDISEEESKEAAD